METIEQVFKLNRKKIISSSCQTSQQYRHFPGRKLTKQPALPSVPYHQQTQYLCQQYQHNYHHQHHHTNQQQQQQQQLYQQAQVVGMGATMSTGASAMSSAMASGGSRTSGGQASGQIVNPCKLFVGNIPRNASLEDVVGIFRRFGPIDERRCVIKECNYAFIYFLRREDAELAQRELNNSLFMGRYIRVQYSHSTRSRGMRSMLKLTCILMKTRVNWFKQRTRKTKTLFKRPTFFISCYKILRFSFSQNIKYFC